MVEVGSEKYIRAFNLIFSFHISSIANFDFGFLLKIRKALANFDLNYMNFTQILINKNY
jgi:hypothetical protein